MKTTLTTVAAVSALLVVGGYASRCALPAVEVDPSSHSILESMDGSAAASVLGEFRTSFSGYMWVKIDEYIHGGVKLRPLSPTEKSAQRARRASTAKEQPPGTHDEHSETTVVPEAERDFRGWMGNVERETQPYFDIRGHQHRDPRETLPLFRFATWADPHFVAGYVVGASIIARDRNRVADAVAYLHEGERNNPHSIEIQVELGRHLAYQYRQFPGAAHHFENAIRLGSQTQTKSEEVDEACLSAYRWLALCYRELGDYGAERKVLQEGLKAYPDDPILERMRRAKGGIRH